MFALKELILMLVTLFAPAAPSSTLALPKLEAPTCDPKSGERPEYTAEQRRETRARVKAVCDYVGAKPIVCAFLDSVVVRESSGRAGVRHHKGVNENGLGATGLSLRWHSDKWPGKDEDPMFCHPEVSALVTLAIMDRAFKRYHAENMVDVQAIFAGRWTCWYNTDLERRQCAADPSQRTINAICSRMEGRSHSCWTHVSRSDLGQPIPYSERREVAAKLIRDFNLK